MCKIHPNEAFGYCSLTGKQSLRDANGKMLKDSKGRHKADGSLRYFKNVLLLD